MTKRIFLYSHGFATRANDNGLFDPIVAAFPNDEHVLFPYDDWNAEDTQATAATFTERAQKLRQKYAELRTANPDAEINLICHSQGCIIAVLAALDNIATTILLAPVINYESGDKQRNYVLQKRGAELRPDGSILRKRSGGYSTLYPANYWDDFVNIAGLPSKYDELNTKTQLIIFDATEDSVIPKNKDYSLLKADIRIEHLALDHDFIEADGSRDGIVAALEKIF